MADKETNTQGNPAQQFAIQKIYTRDISFESPNAPEIFTTEFKPEANVDLNTKSKVINQDGIYEVNLHITVTVKNNSKTAYLAEVQQCGIFTIKGMPEEQLAGMLAVFCPSVLFPYAREAISDIVTRGGFPQMLLAPVNFDAIYAQQLAQQGKAPAVPPESPIKH
ncbi:MAG: protein-export chaperone SecB [Gammaproteobacteria bacterium]|nr:protein-export chaperone SecB [Gammaproteobacteria bacterium]